MSEDGRWVERVGADVSLRLPHASGMVLEARGDVVPGWKIVELASIAGEVRPHHRVHIRLEGGLSNPKADVLGRGGAIYPTLIDDPTVFLDGRARVGLPLGMLILDAGVLGVSDGDGSLQPGVRLALAESSHPGRPWRHTIRVGGLHGPGGSAVTALGEIGRSFGPVEIAVLAEEALYQLSGRPWRAVTHLGGQLAFSPSRPFRLSLTGQLELGRGPLPEGQLMVFATIRLHRGQIRMPDAARDRYLSPWSPHRFSRDPMPRSPGTTPGAEPYPSVPPATEATDAGQ
jgi:hypothetical protein